MSVTNANAIVADVDVQIVLVVIRYLYINSVLAYSCSLVTLSIASIVD